MAIAAQPLVLFSRAGRPESEHRGWLAIHDPGRPAAVQGDYPLTFVRSSMKPFQALPFVLTGAADAFSVSDAELALMCSSHNGQPFQTELVQGLLDRAGIPVSALQCGAHAPYHDPDAHELIRKGEAPTALHNNCSAKHAGFLLLCKHNSWPIENYLDPDHPAQRAIQAAVKTAGGIADGAFLVGVDGCSAPTFAFPLDRLAFLFSQLAKPAPGPYEEALNRLSRALQAHPRHIAGDGRFDTNLMTAGPFIAKGGAEAVHGGVHVPTGRAWAVKIADGGRRAASIAVLAWLASQGLIDPEHPDLAEHRAGIQKNHAERVFGDSQYVGPTTALGSAG
jgi:L-asparaginase II